MLRHQKLRREKFENTVYATHIAAFEFREHAAVRTLLFSRATISPSQRCYGHGTPAYFISTACGQKCACNDGKLERANCGNICARYAFATFAFLSSALTLLSARTNPSFSMRVLLTALRVRSCHRPAQELIARACAREEHQRAPIMKRTRSAVLFQTSHHNYTLEKIVLALTFTEFTGTSH